MQRELAQLCVEVAYGRTLRGLEAISHFVSPDPPVCQDQGSRVVMKSEQCKDIYRFAPEFPFSHFSLSTSSCVCVCAQEGQISTLDVFLRLETGSLIGMA